MKGRLAGALTLACSGVAAAMLLGTLAGCVADASDVEDEAPPVSTALGFQPDVPKVPAQIVPSKQGGAASSDQSSSSTTPPPPACDPNDDSDCADPEPNPWVPSVAPQESHTK